MLDNHMIDFRNANHIKYDVLRAALYSYKPSHPIPQLIELRARFIDSYIYMLDAQSMLSPPSFFSIPFFEERFQTHRHVDNSHNDLNAPFSCAWWLLGRLRTSYTIDRPLFAHHLILGLARSVLWWWATNATSCTPQIPYKYIYIYTWLQCHNNAQIIVWCLVFSLFQILYSF